MRGVAIALPLPRISVKEAALRRLLTKFIAVNYVNLP